MKAVCVTTDRKLEVRDIPAPTAPAPGHVIIEMDSSAINHGDKTFLARPDAAGVAFARSMYEVWGASGAGRIIAAGAGVPADLEGRAVAIYRSLVRSPDTIGLWSEIAQVPHEICVRLPDTVRPRDYCGSLVNVFTAHAYLEEVVAEGHKGVVVTAGTSATGRALVALARRRGMPVIALVRSAAARDALQGLGVEHVVSTADEGCAGALGTLASQLGATAVFDGVGGELVSRIAPVLPLNSTIHFYGLLSGVTPIAVPSMLFLTRNLVMKRFSNFESATARDRSRLIDAMSALKDCIADPVFRTCIGREFSFDQIAAAMAYEETPGAKAVLVA
jgi:NADPH:quinone reductase-like Zn-dependent oxidoreductase